MKWEEECEEFWAIISKQTRNSSIAWATFMHRFQTFDIEGKYLNVEEGEQFQAFTQMDHERQSIILNTAKNLTWDAHRQILKGDDKFPKKSKICPSFEKS